MTRGKKNAPGCPQPIAENQAFQLRPAQSGKPGVLLIHGFTASPWEMRPLAEHLCGSGYHVAAVRLPGHGTSPEDLCRRRCEEWIAAARETLDILGREVGQVHAMGLSTGTLVCLALAAERELCSMVLLSPFLAMQHRLAPLTGLLRYFRTYQHRELPDHLSPYYYDRRPLNGIYQICRLIGKIKPLLPRITTPTLAINALGDRTVRAESGYALFQRLSSPCREYHMFGPGTGHGLAAPDQPSWQAMLDLILRFLAALDPPRPLKPGAP